MVNNQVVVIGNENKELITEEAKKYGIRLTFANSYSPYFSDCVLLVSSGSKHKNVVLKGVEFCTYSDKFSDDGVDYIVSAEGKSFAVSSVKELLGTTLYMRDGSSVESSSFTVIAQRQGKIEPTLDLGLKTSGRRINVDSYMKTSLDCVYAVGSVCTMFGKKTDKEMIECAFADIARRFK